jgi:hypothetical protein
METVMGKKKVAAAFDEDELQSQQAQEVRAENRRPRMSAVEKLLYSRDDASYALSMSRRSVDYLIAGKKLETRRIGSRRLITAESIRRFASGNHFESVAS